MSTSALQTSAAKSLPRVNVADHLSNIALKNPDAVAVAAPGSGDVAGKNSYSTCTFAELEQDASALARGLMELGIRPGTRLVLLVPPGIQFVKLVFALLRSGATTILMDPGMGRKHLVHCLAALQPQGFVAVPRAQAVRAVLRNRFPNATFNITVGRRWLWGGWTYKRLLALGQKSPLDLPNTEAEDLAAIITTSGSTGPPKGVLYTHRMFATQVHEIQKQYTIYPGGTDLACFPLFGLFNSAMGITTVFPDMNFSRPALADPQKLLTAANDWQVTQAFASPAVWKKFSAYCAEKGEKVPTLRKVFSCGAPVPAEVLRKTLDAVAAHAEMHTPYGATESLPVATIEANEVLDQTSVQTDKGAGICVGRKFDTVEWRIIRIVDQPIESIEHTEELPAGETGELIVRGPQVSIKYVTEDLECEDTTHPMPQSTHNSLAKISDGNTVWHRMGDVGYLDVQGRFWYCGRKAHRVVHADETLYTIPCEAIFNTHPLVLRTALVGVGPTGVAVSVLVVEPVENANIESLKTELLQMAGAHPLTRAIQQVLFHPSLPVDIRHNSKINREQLTLWATSQLRNS